MQEEKPVRRGVYILPNLFTTASLFTGFLAMLLAVQGNIEGSALAILFSALMDGLDGKVARLTNTASEFGIQYDSLADLVAFGVAPAFTSWMWVLEGYGKLGIGVAFLYVACTALRLARFNVCVTTVSKKFFVGLPCPAAGCAVAMFILFSSYLPSWLEARTPFLGLVVTFVMALLMVSRVRYFSFKEYGFLKTHAFSSMISALLVFVLILSQPVVFGFLLGAIYLLSGPIYTYGPIIHNEEVVRDLSDKGVMVLETEEELRALPRNQGTVIIRSHGVSRHVYEILKERNVAVVDATCPFVTKIHRIVAEHSAAGEAVVIIGSPDHPEVEGIKGWGNEHTTVIMDGEGADNYRLPEGRKLCIVSQTTFNYNKFKDLVEKFIKKGYDSSVLNTI